MSQITRGFFLGKFLPPHEGHMLTCRTALELVDQLTVMVCSLPSDPIPGHVRFSWVTEMLPAANVIHYDAPIPQEPADHPDFWEIWRNTIRSIHPEPISHVFGSDQYIHQLGSELGAQPVLVDPDREAVPISGSEIRRAPYQNWQYIPEVVRPWFVKRVCIYGPESTGKTMLAKKLAAEFDTVYMPEYGRIFDEQYQPEIWRAEHLIEIARTHEAIRSALLRYANKLMIEDTDAVLTTVWSEALTGEIDSWFEQEFELADLYLLTDIDVPWVNDGLRVFGKDDERKRFFKKAENALQQRGANYEILSGDWDHRDEQARKLVANLLREDNT